MRPQRRAMARLPLAIVVDARRRTPTVGEGRFELPTSRLSGVRSNQLSYSPGVIGGSDEPADLTGLGPWKLD